MRLSIAVTVALSVVAITACSANSEGRPWHGGASASSGSYQLEITDQWGSPLRAFQHNGRTWVMGERGQRYCIKVHNHSSRRIEAVISADGRDAIDGRPGHTSKRGYLIDPHDHLLVDGFRVSLSNVATFRFSSVANSYAARMGNAREVGVIGVAIYQEYRRPRRRPRYYSKRYRPRDELGDADGARGGAAQEAPAPEASAKADAPASRSGGYGRSSKSARRSAEAMQRPGLGTRYGESRHAPATEVAFRRARSWRPDRVLSLRYNDRRGLLAMGIDVDGRRWRRSERRRRETARPFADMQRNFAAPPPGWRE